jgi:hypothetical protein
LGASASALAHPDWKGIPKIVWVNAWENIRNN